MEITSLRGRVAGLFAVVNVVFVVAVDFEVVVIVLGTPEEDFGVEERGFCVVGVLSGTDSFTG